MCSYFIHRLYAEVEWTVEEWVILDFFKLSLLLYGSVASSWNQYLSSVHFEMGIKSENLKDLREWGWVGLGFFCILSTIFLFPKIIQK